MTEPASPGPATTGAPMVHVTVHSPGTAPRPDQVATEEPLEIRIDHRGTNHRIAVTMRTPGDDRALAAGFLFTEGIIQDGHDIIEARHCGERGPEGTPVYNIIEVLISPKVPFDPERFRRNVYTTSSCGVCGKASIDAIEVACTPIDAGRPRVPAPVLQGLPEKLRGTQTVFQETGGLHASGLFDTDGTRVDVREDVGRHNATDKVIGHALQNGHIPLSDTVLMVSGRASFEIVQKAARAGIPIVAAIGAPSSLAVEAADRLGVTLVGFVRPSGLNVYTHPERITSPPT